MRSNILFIAVILLFSDHVYAQWVSDSTVNTPVCTSINTQKHPNACSDGADGVIVVWEDYRDGYSWKVYAQKLDANGKRQWPINGVRLCTAAYNQTNPIIASDGEGGAYVVWEDARNLDTSNIDLFAQHILEDGTLVYPKSGLTFAHGNGNQVHAAITDDGFGNAFVAWEDSRTSIRSATRPNIWMNKLIPTDQQWGSEGVEVIDQDLRQRNIRLIADGSGGCLMAWESTSTLTSTIFATVVNSDGVVQWPAPYSYIGEQIYSGFYGNSCRNVAITRDGNQFLFAWEEYNSYNSSKGWNVLARRVRLDGSFVWGIISSASEVSADYPGDQTNPIIFSDDSNVTFSGQTAKGALVVYQDYTGDKNIVMTRLLGDGASLKPAYPSNLFGVCRLPNDQQNPKAVKSGTGEVLVAWEDKRNSSSSSTTSSIYCQRVDKTPKRLLGPSPSVSSWGVALSNRQGVSCSELVLVPRTNGGITVWRDNRTDFGDIFAQLIFKDGTLPIELSNFSIKELQGGRALLEWQTVSEKDNDGFEVERRLISDIQSPNTFEVVGSYRRNPTLRGLGSSNRIRDYSFVDCPGKLGVYEYRLVDYSLDGEYTAHEPKIVKLSNAVASHAFSVGSLSPNPFSEKTAIPLTLPQDALVDLNITDVLGRVIGTPYSGVYLSTGNHTLQINAGTLGIRGPSQAYYYSVIIRDPLTGLIVWRMPQAGKFVKL